MIHRVETSGDSLIVMTLDRRFFSLNAKGATLLSSVRGTTELRGSDPSHAVLIGFFKNFLVKNGIYMPAVASCAPQARRRGHSLLLQRELLPASRVTAIAAWLVRRVPPAVALGCIVLALAAMLFYTAHHPPSDALAALAHRSAPQWLAVAALLLCGALVHEFGHAIICTKLAGSTGGMGYGFYAIYPAFYADVSEIHLLGRIERAWVGAAGVACQLVFVAALIPFAGQPAVGGFILISQVQMLCMLLPFYRSDGFWILNDLAGTRNLLRESLRRLCNRDAAPRDIAALALVLGLTGLGLAWAFLRVLWPMMRQITLPMLGALGDRHAASHAPLCAFAGAALGEALILWGLLRHAYADVGTARVA